MRDGPLLVAVHLRTGTGTARRVALLVLRLSAAGMLLDAAEVLSATNADAKWTVAALPDESVLIARSLREAGAPVFSASLYRLLPDNSFDRSYGANGAFPLAAFRTVDALAVDGEDRLLVVGQSAEGGLLVRYDLDQAIAVATVVEFLNVTLQHYFITADPVEAAAIDAGAAGPGWQRTGLSFTAGGPTLLCRFYGNTNPNPATGAIYGPNSHFYTADPVECAGLKASYTPTTKSWKFESYDFATTTPQFAANDATTCPAGTLPVYRAYNNGFARGVDSNHRFTTDVPVYQQMIASGWIGEGIVMCAPA